MLAPGCGACQFLQGTKSLDTPGSWPYNKPRRSCDFGNKLVFREGFSIVTIARRGVWLLVLFGVALAVLAALPVEAQTAAQGVSRDPAYRAFPVFGSRLAVWAVAQLHLNFAAFI